MKTQINIRASAITARQLEQLTAHLGTSITETITMAVDRLYREEIGTSVGRSPHDTQPNQGPDTRTH